MRRWWMCNSPRSFSGHNEQRAMSCQHLTVLIKRRKKESDCLDQGVRFYMCVCVYAWTRRSDLIESNWGSCVSCFYALFCVFDCGMFATFSCPTEKQQLLCSAFITQFASCFLFSREINRRRQENKNEKGDQRGGDGQCVLP